MASASSHLLLLPLISVCLICGILENEARKSSHEEHAHDLRQEEKTLGRDSLGCKLYKALLFLSAFIDMFEQHKLLHAAQPTMQA